MSVELDRIALTSVSPNAERLAALKVLFPEVFTEGKIDFDRLKQVLGGPMQTDRERYGLNWAGKTDAIHVLQSLSVGTLEPVREASVNFDATENMIIEGDNLEVLKLLQKSYFGKVKMIYIDPPYNTGNEFIYPDNFREGLEDYLRFSGQMSAEGTAATSNKETDGRYHSKWLSMMYPRLFLAKNLLREDGVIFVSIDDNELHNLRLMMNEIFGEENFRNNVIVRRGIKNVQSQFEEVQQLSVGHEYILIYSRSASAKLPKLDKAHDKQQGGKWDTFWRGTDRPTMRYELFGQTPESGQWRWEEDRANTAIKNYELFLQNKDENISLDDYYLDSLMSNNDKLDFVRLGPKQVVQYFVPPKDSKLLSDNWMDVTLSGNHPNFENPKNPEIIKRMIKWITSSNDIILDFFAGSGTTAHAVLEVNEEDNESRNFILVQLPEKTKNKQFPTIADITRQRVRQIVDEMKEADTGKLPLEGNAAPDRGFKALHLAASNFKIWEGTEGEEDADAIAVQLELFADNLLPDATPENILFEILLKAGYDLNVPCEEISIGGHSIYSIADGQHLICLERDITRETVDGMIERKPAGVICLDEAFHGDDALLTNTLLQMQDAEIIFQTI